MGKLISADRKARRRAEALEDLLHMTQTETSSLSLLLQIGLVFLAYAPCLGKGFCKSPIAGIRLREYHGLYLVEIRFAIGQEPLFIFPRSTGNKDR
jgi:hypothetical protein